jgi:hypothetical protein
MFTVDSSASESRPTDPVAHQAAIFIPNTTTLTTIDIHANFARFIWVLLI